VFWHRLENCQEKLAPSRHISPIFGILGERLRGVRDFPTKVIAEAMAAGEKFRKKPNRRSSLPLQLFGGVTAESVRYGG
jgi:hypothetical protein